MTTESGPTAANLAAPETSIAGRLRQNEFVRNGALVFGAQMAVNVCNFAFHALVSRRIGVVAYGSLTALVSGFQVLQVPGLILTTVLVKYAASFRARSQISRLPPLLSHSMAVLGGGAAAVFLLGVALSGSIGAYLHGIGRLPVILMWGILCINLVLPIRGILQGLERFKPFSLSLSMEALVKVVFALVFTGIGWGLVGALGGWLLGSALALAYTWLVQWIPYRKLERVRLNLNLGRLLSTTGGVALATLFVTSLGFSDVVLVKHYFNPAAAGLYGAAALCGKMLYFLVYFVPAVALPRVATNVAEGKPTRPILIAALSIVLLFGATGTAFYGFFGGFVVQTLAGHAFAAAAPLVFPYGIASTLLATLNLAVIYKIGLGHFKFVVPLGVVAVLQIAGISFSHSSPGQVIDILIGCNIAGLLVTLTRSGRSSLNPAERQWQEA